MRSILVPNSFDDRDATRSKRFASHLAATMRLSHAQLERCVEALEGLEDARTRTQLAERVRGLATEFGLENVEVTNALSVIRFLKDAMLNEQLPADDSAHWAGDFEECGWLKNKEERSTFEYLVSVLTRFRHSHERQLRAKAAAVGVLPAFEGIGATVEARAIRGGTFRWGQDVKSYKPELLGTVMIASIHISADAGPNGEFYFQVDETDLDNLIDSLLATKAEMVALRAYLTRATSEEPIDGK
jgi:hypothetical protein